MSRPADTSEDAYRFQIDLWRRLSGQEKVEIARRWSRRVRDVLREGIRSRHAEYSDEEVRLAAMHRLLGGELFAEAFPGRPLLDP